MKTDPELKADLGHSVRSAGDILKKAKEDDGRSLTADEQKEFDKFKDQSKSIQKDIDALAATNARAAELEEMEARLKEPETRKMPPIKITDAADRVSDEGDPEPVRYGKTVAFADTAEGRKKAYRAGQWCRAVFCGDEAARRYCVNHGIGEMRAQSEGINTAGGVFVPEELNQAIIDLRVKYGVFRQHANVLPMGRDTMIIPRTTNDLTATFTGENTALTESDATFNDVELTAKKLGILTRISSELADDAIIDIGDMITRKMAYAFAKKEDQCGFIGDGSPTYGGILGIATIFNNTNALAGAVDGAATIDLFSEMTTLAINNVMGNLPDYGWDNAKFFVSRVGAEVMFSRLKGALAGNTISDIEGNLRQSWLGYEIVYTDVMTKVQTSLNNLTMFLFGDLSLSSTLGDSRGISVRTSEERYFESDQLAIKATERIAINNHDYGDNTNAGPIVSCLGVT